MPTLNQRAQTGSLQETALIPGQTIVDSYVQPRKPTKGYDLMQLGQALDSLNPGIRSILGKLAAKEQDDKDKANYAQGLSERLSTPDETEAQNKLTTGRAQWDPARIRGYEVGDAQQHSNLMPNAFRDALVNAGLWNNEKADPRAVQSTVAKVVSDFAARGEDNGPDWKIAFDQRAQEFSSSAITQWGYHIGEVREKTAEIRYTDDLVQQLMSHTAIPEVDDIASSFNAYAEKSADRYLLPEQRNAAKVAAFTTAYEHALFSDTPDAAAMAERIQAAFMKIPTGEGGLLYKTKAGAEVARQMAVDLHTHNAQASQERELKQAAERQDALTKLSFLKQPFRNSLPSGIPNKMPDGLDGNGKPINAEELAEQMDRSGMDPDKVWASFREGQLDGLKADREEVTLSPDTVTANDALEQTKALLLNAKTTQDLGTVLEQLHAMESDPAFKNYQTRAPLNALYDEALAMRSRFNDTGKMGSQPYSNTEAEIRQYGYTATTVAQKAIASFRVEQGSSDFGKLAKQLNFQTLTDENGNLNASFDDINRDMVSDWIKEADSTQNGRDVSEVPREEWRAAADKVQKKYAPIYDQRLADIKKGLTEIKRSQETAEAADLSNTALSVATGRTIAVAAPSGIPTHASVLNVKSLTSTGRYLSNVLRYDDAISSNTQRWADFIGNNETFTSPVPSTFLKFVNGSILGYPQPTSNSDYYEQTRSKQENLYTGTTPQEQQWAKDNGYSGGGTVFQAAKVLKSLEANKALMDAVKQTTTNQQMSNFNPGQQIAYSNLRVGFLKMMSQVGMDTTRSTADKFELNPDWLDWRTVPMFTYISDITDDNAKKAMTNLKLNITPDSFRDFVDVQRAIAVQRSKTYGFPLQGHAK